ncbi:MAG TPA: hypothetical protein DHW02_14760 [Ktedonobacter sp.]|nr:hypothetical protein [Ktedonobacter sp.]
MLLQKLEEIRRGGKYDFPGTVARYIIGYESSPDEIEILLIWKSSVMPDETERERHLETFRKALVDVLDWETARYEHGVVYMHT